MKAAGDFIESLISEEIRRTVADAIGNHQIVSASECAAQILKAYRGTHLSEAELTNRVMMAAASAGVAVELGHFFEGPVAASNNTATRKAA
jgi:hypothetical protein